jgi:transcriptional regulator with XRE-family HTH domain
LILAGPSVDCRRRFKALKLGSTGCPVLPVAAPAALSTNNHEAGVAKIHGADFKRWRKSLDLSQKEAAEALGLKRRVVQYYEKGERDGKSIDIPKTVRLACFALTKGEKDYGGPEDGSAHKGKRKSKSEDKRRKDKDKHKDKDKDSKSKKHGKTPKLETVGAPAKTKPADEKKKPKKS